MTTRPPASALKARLNAGEVVGCYWLSLGSPAMVELALDAGADTIVIDTV
jgi:2-keto-3-deoxy-L-rhamnonate aldolase RhmA